MNKPMLYGEQETVKKPDLYGEQDTTTQEDVERDTHLAQPLGGLLGGEIERVLTTPEDVEHNPSVAPASDS